VDVFFVLSGFLITRLLLEEQERTGTIAWRRFIQRRLWRLAPALGVFLAVYLVVAPLAWPNHPHLRDAAWAAIYFSDYSQALLGQPDYLIHTWSLSVEEHFYLLWPIALGLLYRATQRTRHPEESLTLVLLGGWVLATAWRVGNALHAPDQFELTYFRFDTRTSGLWLGAVLAALPRTRWAATAVQPGILAAVALCALAAVTTTRHPQTHMLTYGILAAEIGTAACLWGVLRGQAWICAPLTLPWLMWLGQVSYAVYLWHYPIQRYLRGWEHWPTTLLLGTAISLVIAWASWKWIEQPLLLRRDRASKVSRPSAA
jgi:peptidoglycan/LPS O-acetylase OafA/YrhL